MTSHLYTMCYIDNRKGKARDTRPTLNSLNYLKGSRHYCE